MQGISNWAVERFGSVAARLCQASALALDAAHNAALAAHAAGGLDTADAYGATLWVQQHKQLIHFAKDIPGVVARKPMGVRSRHALLVIEATNVVIYPWRFATDRTVRRENAKFRAPVSDLRLSLLSLTQPVSDPQLTLDDAQFGQDELETRWAEEDALRAQLAAWGRVVILGYGANSGAGIFVQGFGEAELVNPTTGAVRWHHWEALATAAADAESKTFVGPTVVEAADPDFTPFDADDELDDDFGLTPRGPLDPTPISEPEADVDGAANDEKE